MDPKVGAEYEHRTTGVLVRIVEANETWPSQVYRIWSYKTGRKTWVTFETLYRTYRLVHRCVRAKVGTGPGTLITLLQLEEPSEGDYVEFIEILNGKKQGGYVDGVSQVDRKPFYLIVRW